MARGAKMFGFPLMGVACCKICPSTCKTLSVCSFDSTARNKLVNCRLSLPNRVDSRRSSVPLKSCQSALTRLNLDYGSNLACYRILAIMHTDLASLIMAF